MFEETTQVDFQKEPARELTASAPLSARLVARLIQGRLDRDLVAGVTPAPGSALAVHARRLESRDEREALSRALRAAVVRAESDALSLTWRMPVQRRSVLAAREFIDDITLRLHAQRPVSYRAVARLRVLMADGTGPLYRVGRGSLTAELKAVLARM